MIVCDESRDGVDLRCRVSVRPGIDHGIVHRLALRRYESMDLAVIGCVPMKKDKSDTGNTEVGTDITR